MFLKQIFAQKQSFKGKYADMLWADNVTSHMDSIIILNQSGSEKI